MTIDPADPFTRELLRSLTATIRAQPDETDAEYADRFASAVKGFAALKPRDPVEQMLAAQIVAAQNAGLDCIARAAQAEDQKVIDKLHRSFAMMNRVIVNTLRLLDEQRGRSEEDLASSPPAIAPIPPRRRPPAPSAPQIPMQREKPKAAPPKKDPAKMTDEELQAALADIRTLYFEAIADPNHPEHQEALRIQAEDRAKPLAQRCYEQMPVQQ